jgi:hypothetical protein
MPPRPACARWATASTTQLGRFTQPDPPARKRTRTCMPAGTPSTTVIRPDVRIAGGRRRPRRICWRCSRSGSHCHGLLDRHWMCRGRSSAGWSGRRLWGIRICPTRGRQRGPGGCFHERHLVGGPRLQPSRSVAGTFHEVEDPVRWGTARDAARSLSRQKGARPMKRNYHSARRRWRGALATSIFGFIVAGPPQLLDSGPGWDVGIVGAIGAVAGGVTGFLFPSLLAHHPKVASPPPPSPSAPSPPPPRPPE